MRIIAGELKGRTLQSREGKGTRPTDARAREMLFNILSERVIDARFLDLYGGTGSVGLEALSRGASFCVFIEQNAAACRVIKANLKALGLGERAQVWNASVKSALKRLQEDEKRFDIVFCDPPFDNARELPDLCRALDKSRSLLDNVTGHKNSTAAQTDSFVGPADPEIAPESSSLLIIQHHRKATPQLNAPWQLQQERRAGESTLSFFQ